MNEILKNEDVQIVKIEEGKIIMMPEVVNKIIELTNVTKELDYLKKRVNQELMEAMQKVGRSNFITEGLSAVLKSGTTRTTIDSKRLKEECPDIYEEYSKTSEVKPSIVLTIAE